jgi:opacity protein-like surface antigen
MNGMTNFSESTRSLVAFSLRNSTVLAQMEPDQWQVLGLSEPGAPGFGGFLGYNVQWDNAVIGLELNYSHTSLSAVAPDVPIGRWQFVSGQNNNVFLDASGSFHISDVATTRARFGWTFDNFMPYGTIGLAFGRADIALSTSVLDAVANGNVVVAQLLFTQSQAKSQTFIYGFSGGVGIEVALTQNIFGRADYEYMQWQRLWQITSGLQMLASASA